MRTRSTRGAGSSCAIAFAALLTVAVILGNTCAFAQCQYEATALPNVISFGFPVPVPVTAVNNLGHAVGHISGFNDTRAVMWTGGTQWTLLVLPPGFDGSRADAINDLDEVVGWAYDTVPSKSGGTLTTNYACLWRDGQPIVLGIPPGGTQSYATGINNKSEICGYWGNFNTGDPPIQAFIWRDGVMTSLNVPFLEAAEAEDINEHSEIAGWGGNQGPVYRCFRWSEGVANELATLPGAVLSRASAIGDNGCVVGRSSFPISGSKYLIHRATVWSHDGATMLPLLPGFQSSAAYGANCFATVGECDNYPNPGHAAFLYQDGVVHDLTDLIVQPAVVSYATAINDRGDIVARARLGPPPGQDFMVLLRAINRPVADITQNCRVDVDDLVEVILRWGDSNSPADVTGDGTVSSDDLLMVLLDWT